MYLSTKTLGTRRPDTPNRGDDDDDDDGDEDDEL
jgi:hypothetical protein